MPSKIPSLPFLVKRPNPRGQQERDWRTTEKVLCGLVSETTDDTSSKAADVSGWAGVPGGSCNGFW